jgi:hypothetical protein
MLSFQNSFDALKIDLRVSLSCKADFLQARKKHLNDFQKNFIIEVGGKNKWLILIPPYGATVLEEKWLKEKLKLKGR